MRCSISCRSRIAYIWKQSQESGLWSCAAALSRQFFKILLSENGIYGHSRFCNTDFDDKLACLNLSGV
ncbi:hypothetical protein EWQ00_28580 [Klebsiella pneumoniae]|nr:hypothetical protein EWQ00_28580 [Klebsiella pneumoniae]